MKSVQVLDCTLRDGGYCNQWNFGFNNSKSIINCLVEANIDIVECGFITDSVTYNKEVTKFNKVEEIATIIPINKKNKLFVVMMNYGEYDINKLPIYDGNSIDGFRVAFHKKNRYEALALCKQIKEKGYKVFIQPMVSVTYSDTEFIEMIHIVNDFMPYAFYIVDSFGMMKSKDLNRLFYMVENNLNSNINIGFHSHNNMQLAYSNAQSLLATQTNRDLIIDSSIYGMGRGAGNLNTELFVEYLNEVYGKNYVLQPLLQVIDDILEDFYHKNYWGYSLPNYLSAKHNAHPNYAGFLSDKNTLTYKEIDEIFSMMPQDKKVEFDKKYIEELYSKYMEKGTLQETRGEELISFLKDKKVLLIAPGKSSVDEIDKIKKFATNDNVISISVNFEYKGFETNYVFLSNLRRYKEIENTKKEKCIVTSNIPFDNVYYQVDYKTLTNDEEFVTDNAGLMCIKMLIGFDVKDIYLAGFDGYSHNTKENYGDSSMELVTRNAVLDKINEGMNKIINEYAKKCTIHFITTPKYTRIK